MALHTVVVDGVALVMKVRIVDGKGLCLCLFFHSFLEREGREE